MRRLRASSREACRGSHRPSRSPPLAVPPRTRRSPDGSFTAPRPVAGAVRFRPTAACQPHRRPDSRQRRRLRGRRRPHHRRRIPVGTRTRLLVGSTSCVRAGLSSNRPRRRGRLRARCGPLSTPVATAGHDHRLEAQSPQRDADLACRLHQRQPRPHARGLPLKQRRRGRDRGLRRCWSCLAGRPAEL
jgi:hypothetical protein